MKNVKDIYPINLQLFGEENGADPNAGSENAAQATEEQAESKPRMYTEEEVKAKLDHHMAQYRKSESKRIEQAREEARAEHERQRVEQAAKDREAAIDQREAELNRRELRATAIEDLRKRGLPTSLEIVLNYTDADACHTSIDTVEKAFREAVQQGVDERLRQSGVTVRAGNVPDYAKMSDAEYYAATYKTGGQK